ncbi:hypothetical protein QJQ45_001174 [Haematococcus lacustris]|nr:hypothetical protein QJQ45_001174 [Haematococcus lacustris]
MPVNSWAGSKSDDIPEFMDATPKDCQVSVASTWHQAMPALTDASLMTSPLGMVDAEVQALERGVAGTQTDDSYARRPNASKAAHEGVTDFVHRAAELMTQEFARLNEELSALEPLGFTPEQDEEPAVCILELTPFAKHDPDAGPSSTQPQPAPSFNAYPTSTNGSSNGPSHANPSPGSPAMMRAGGQARVAGGVEAPGGSVSQGHRQLVVTSLTWSCTGQTVAASYGRYDVPGWCSDRGALVAWNLGRDSVKPGKPDVLVDVDVCLMVAAFHPEHPALIAGGTFNGDLYVWDLSQEADLQVARSDPLCEVRHQEPMAALKWQYSLTDATKYGNRSQAYRLISLAADGRVIVWSWHKLDTPLCAYQLLWPAQGLDRKIVWGGTSMSFAHDTPGAAPGGKSASGAARPEGGGLSLSSNTFFVGTEGGRVFRCYLDVNDIAGRAVSRVKQFQKGLAAGERPELRCPIKDAAYASHAGAVYGLDCSPYQRDVFLTGGADGSLRLYHALKQQALLVLEPANAQLHLVNWSPSRPLVFAAAAGKLRGLAGNATTPSRSCSAGLGAVQAVQSTPALSATPSSLALHLSPDNCLMSIAGDGRVYIYDLLRARDIIRPVAVLDASPAGGPVFAQAFNHKRPDMFATGDSTSIQIWRLPDGLSTSRKGEAALLRRLAAADDAAEAVRRHCLADVAENVPLADVAAGPGRAVVACQSRTCDRARETRAAYWEPVVQLTVRMFLVLPQTPPGQRERVRNMVLVVMACCDCIEHTFGVNKDHICSRVTA